ARKEAEKEEKMLQKALEKARSELGQASEEQRAVFEAQLAELESKLQEAEEKGQRALSMAQQTRRGHVYVISNVGSFGEEVFKIGMTRRLEPMDRVKELGDASVPFS
ncbi:GIY-YIG nuclease family protein, partial [Vibrio sp. 10N.222.52.B7]